MPYPRLPQCRPPGACRSDRNRRTSYDVHPEEGDVSAGIILIWPGVEVVNVKKFFEERPSRKDTGSPYTYTHTGLQNKSVFNPPKFS